MWHGHITFFGCRDSDGERCGVGDLGVLKRSRGEEIESDLGSNADVDGVNASEKERVSG